MEIETLDLNAFSADDSANSCITQTPGVCDDINSPNPFFSPINPTPDTHINDNFMMKMSTVTVINNIVVKLMTQLRK